MTKPNKMMMEVVGNKARSLLPVDGTSLYTCCWQSECTCGWPNNMRKSVGTTLDRLPNELIPRSSTSTVLQDDRPHYDILRRFCNPSDHYTHPPTTGFHATPAWLGHFKFRQLPITETRKELNSLPSRIKDLIYDMEAIVPYQKFNTVFIQRYDVGGFVKLHRDPKNNVGYTAIAILGDFEGAETTIHRGEVSEKFTLEAGDVLVLPCFMNDVQGDPHEVSPVTRGTRYAIILNTIKRSEPEEPSKVEELFS